MGFWDGEQCEYCSGDIVERIVDLHRKIGGKHILIENVPMGVCSQCGARFFAANVLKTVDETIKGRRQARREIKVPIFTF